MMLGAGIKTSLVFLEAFSMLGNLVLAPIKNRGHFFSHSQTGDFKKRDVQVIYYVVNLHFNSQYGS